MNTPSIEELISAYIDGELDAASEKDVRQEIASDPRLQELDRNLRELSAQIRSLPAVKPDRALTESIVAKLEPRVRAELIGETASDIPLRRRPGISRSRTWLRVAAAALTTVAATALVVVLWNPQIFQGDRAVATSRRPAIGESAPMSQPLVTSEPDAESSGGFAGKNPGIDELKKLELAREAGSSKDAGSIDKQGGMPKSAAAEQSARPAQQNEIAGQSQKAAPGTVIPPMAGEGQAGGAERSTEFFQQRALTTEQLEGGAAGARVESRSSGNKADAAMSLQYQGAPPPNMVNQSVAGPETTGVVSEPVTDMPGPVMADASGFPGLLQQFGVTDMPGPVMADAVGRPSSQVYSMQVPSSGEPWQKVVQSIAGEMENQLAPVDENSVDVFFFEGTASQWDAMVQRVVAGGKGISVSTVGPDGTELQPPDLDRALGDFSRQNAQLESNAQRLGDPATESASDAIPNKELPDSRMVYLGRFEDQSGADSRSRGSRGGGSGSDAMDQSGGRGGGLGGGSAGGGGGRSMERSGVAGSGISGQGASGGSPGTAGLGRGLAENDSASAGSGGEREEMSRLAMPNQSGARQADPAGPEAVVRRYLILSISNKQLEALPSATSDK